MVIKNIACSMAKTTLKIRVLPLHFTLQNPKNFEYIGVPFLYIVFREWIVNFTKYPLL